MNMFQLQERIKDFSKDQLVKEMQQPSGAVPPFLVLSELQRRTRMEKAFQAEQAQGQQSTVAQDAIAAAGVPQGGIADMARAMAPQTDMAGNTGAMPVQNMYGGGEVKRMKPGGEVEGPNTAALRAIVEAQNTIRGMQARNRAMQAMLNRTDGIAGLETVDTDLSAFRPTPAPREEARPRGYTPPMTLPSLTSLDPLSTAETPQIAVTGDQTAAPRLVNRDGEQFAEMPDGSLIPLEDLGVSPAELAGADTADLAARPGFAGRDLASERMGAGFDTIGGLGAPMLSSADRTSFGADTAVGGSRRAFDMPTPAGDMETPLVASLTGESGLDIRVPPSAASLGFGGSGFDIENLTEEQREEYNSLTPEQQENVRLYGVPGPRPSDPTFGGATAAIEDAVGPDPLPAPSMTIPEAIRAYEEFEQRGPKLQDILSGRVAAEREAAREAEAARMMEINEIPATARKVTDEGKIISSPQPKKDTDSGGTGGGARAAGTADADKWLALAQFGLGLMASQAPTLGGAIGEAGTMALSQLRESQKDAYERDLAERTLAVRAANGRGSQFPAAGANLFSEEIAALTAQLASPMVKQDRALRDKLQSQLDTLLAQQRLLQAAYLSQYGLSGALNASAPAGDLSTVRANVSDE